MQDRHTNRKRYFDELAVSSRKYFLPYLEEFFPITSSTRILEIGCGDGGNLLPFAERQCSVTGIDLAETRILQAREFFAESGCAAQFKAVNVFDMTPEKEKYDVILIQVTFFNRLIINYLYNYIAYNMPTFLIYYRLFLT